MERGLRQGVQKGLEMKDLKAAVEGGGLVPLTLTPLDARGVFASRGQCQGGKHSPRQGGSASRGGGLH